MWSILVDMHSDMSIVAYLQMAFVRNFSKSSMGIHKVGVISIWFYKLFIDELLNLSESLVHTSFDTIPEMQP